MKFTLLSLFLTFLDVGTCHVYSKVLVAYGWHTQAIADVEIIDLQSSQTTCQKPADFPYPNLRASGGLGYHEKPLLCGIYHSNSKACYLYENGVWKTSGFLNQIRYGSATTMTPFSNQGKLIVTGGMDQSGEVSSSAEVLTPNGWQVLPPVPVKIGNHCMVTINSNNIMVIGGNQTGLISGKTFFFNSVSQSWTEGPTLNSPRAYHSCELIRQNRLTKQKSVIVLGGWNGSQLKSVEILDLGSNAWRKGPELQISIANAASVQDPSGGVVLIGGYNDEKGVLDTFYRLSDARGATWELMSQKLEISRSDHAAILVPDQVASCI